MALSWLFWLPRLVILLGNEKMKPTLLVVDDEPQLLRLMTQVLEGEDYAVVSAPDGDEAISVLGQHVDSLCGAVIDVFIPPRGSGEVLEALHAARPDLGLIVVSGAPLEEGMAQRVESMGGRFLQKPFRPSTLIETVRDLFDASAGTGDV